MKTDFGEFVKRVHFEEMRGLKLKQFIRKYEFDIQELLKKRGEEISIQEGTPILPAQANSIKINILFEIQLRKIEGYGKEDSPKIPSILSESGEPQEDMKLTQGTLF